MSVLAATAAIASCSCSPPSPTSYSCSSSSFAAAAAAAAAVKQAAACGPRQVRTSSSRRWRGLLGAHNTVISRWKEGST